MYIVLEVLYHDQIYTKKHYKLSYTILSSLASSLAVQRDIFFVCGTGPS